MLSDQCYGSLITFNVLFKNKEHWFNGERVDCGNISNFTYHNIICYLMRLILSLLIAINFYSSTCFGQSVNQIWGLVYRGNSGDIVNTGVIQKRDSNGVSLKNYPLFANGSDGGYPLYGEMVDLNGVLYGMTSGGGPDSGVIYSFDPGSDVYTKKFNFRMNTTGNNPGGGLALRGGKFYGMTQFGTSGNHGGIFEWDPVSNVCNNRVVFTTLTGYEPKGGLTEYNNMFYGVTQLAGANSGGTLFQWDPASNTFTKKHDLVSATGVIPYADLVVMNNKLYGTTSQGGSTGHGVIFEWDPATDSYLVVAEFDGTNGSSPVGKLAVWNGKLYGNAKLGGSANQGTIYECDPTTNTITKKQDFITSNGARPESGLKLYDNKFFATTTLGGINNQGVLFEWDPSANLLSTKYEMQTSTGGRSGGTLALHNNKLYGTCFLSAAGFAGTLFQYDPVLESYSVKYNFSTFAFPNGNLAINQLTFAQGKFYGVSLQGGTFNKGVLFEFNPENSTVTKKIDFSSSLGETPRSRLFLKNDKLYGLTSAGGTFNGGVIYQYDLSTGVYTKLHDLDQANGYIPYGSFMEYNGKFYVTLSSGGASNDGAIAEFDPATNTYTKKIDLVSASGRQPYSTLTAYNNKLYGMTTLGGAFNSGVLFEYDPATNVYTQKVEFIPTEVDGAFGTLTLYNNKFYGLSYRGSTGSRGSVFVWDPATNILTKKATFSLANGYNPLGSLTISQNAFYAYTQSATGFMGAVIKFDPSTDLLTTVEYLNNVNGSFPNFENGFIRVPAPIASGRVNACYVTPSVEINSSNNNRWVPLVDSTGDVVAEINANGNNLGVISSSFYLHGGPVREDGNNRLYLNRNFTITPENQPLTPVSLRLYITETEFGALKNATNSLGQSSGISVPEDVLIFKNNDQCVSAVSGTLNPVPLSGSLNYNGYGYMLTASISSFSSFYLTNATGAALPVTMVNFTGKREGDIVTLRWTTEDEYNLLNYTLERSVNGLSFQKVADINPRNSLGTQDYIYLDSIGSIQASKHIYYRLKYTELDGSFNFSRTLMIPVDVRKNRIAIYPNPANNELSVSLTTDKKGKAFYEINNVYGQVLLTGVWELNDGTQTKWLDIARLKSGVYYLTFQQGAYKQTLKLIKK